LIELDSDKWKSLEHAYGSAEDIPDLLSALEKYPPSGNYRSEPYYSLWGALCHQGDTYSASIAALPHLVRLCQKSPEKVHWSVMQLAVCIEISRLEGLCSNDTSDESYSEAVRTIIEICDAIRKHQPSKEIDQIYRAAVFAVNGDWESADLVFMEDD
jgi:hypothetical protein